MTCAISQQQAEKLYKNVYKSLSESLKSTDKIFDADKYMENLFNSIADKKDEDTAIKFLQQVPSIIRVIASKPAFDDLDLKLDPIKDLGKSFKNIDKGFDNVLKHFKPQMTQRSKMALLRANQIEAENAKEVDPPADGMETVRLRVSDALTSTMSQLIPVNPTKKQGLIEEKIDTGKQRIYTALERIAEKVSTNENAEINETITYQDVKLKLKPILLSKLAETHKDQLDTETRINLLEKSKAINDRGLTPKGVDTINTIALVLTDADGIYQYFDAEGNITTKEKGGGIVYQFLRQTRKNFGKFEVVNAYGIAGVTQTPQEIAAITGESVEEVTKKQQAEFAQLDALRESAKKGEAPLLNFTGLSAGVKESIGQKTITLQNLREFAFVNNATFRTIRPVMTPGQDTSAVIELNGKEYPLDRPNLPVNNVKGVRTPGDLIKKIAAVLANPKISNEKKHSFVNQFLSDNASSATRRHKINYHPGTNVLLFSYTEKTLEEGSGKTFALTNEELNGKESIFEEVLTNAAKDKYGNFYGAKMSYPEQVLGKNGYEDYNLETGEIATELSPYLPLLETLPNAKIKISQQTDPGFFNSYMKFSLPSDFVTQLDNALNEPEVELNEEPISDLAYNVFVETNIVSDKILNDIADAYLKGEPLSLRQQAIFMATTANMEKIFAERKKVDFTTTDTKAGIEDTIELTNEELNAGPTAGNQTFNKPVSTKEEIKVYVAGPVLKASEIFWDKNIKTTGSWVPSIQDVGGKSGPNNYIEIEYDSLSEENKKIALELTEEGSFRTFGKSNSVRIVIPGNNLSIEEIQRKSIEIANKFKNQDLLWYTPKTLDEAVTDLEDYKKKYPDSAKEIDAQIQFEKDTWGQNLIDKYFDKVTNTIWASEELYKKSIGAPATTTKVTANVKPVYHHTSVAPENFNFNTFQRGKNQISQFGDGLNASSNTTSFLVNKYGKAIEGEVNDSDFVVIDANKSQQEMYEILTAKGFKFNTPQVGKATPSGATYLGGSAKIEYDDTNSLKDAPGAAISLFNDFQESNPEVKGVKVINHIIGNEKVAPFYVIYDAKSFYGPGSLSKNIDQKTSIDNIIDPKNTNNPSKGGLSSLFELDRKGVDLGKITQQDIDSAQEWWSNSPLAKYIDFKTMVNIVNSDVYAKFIAYGSKLNEKFGKIEIGSRGTLVDVYHEAWHAFSQIFLTPAQRTQLYNEVAKQKGTFTLLDGTTVKFSEASYLQLEEYLAEDFRTYGIDQGVKKGSPVRNSIFRRIANFLKQLFTKKSTKETLFKNLYFADKNKNFLNKYSPVVDTFSFNVLNRGIGSIENAEVEVLSKQDSNTISKSIDSYISDIVDNIGEEQGNSSPTLRLFIGETNRNALYSLVKKDFEEKLGDAQIKYDAIKENPAEVIEAEKLDNKIRIFKAALENFGDAKKGVIKYHLENSTFNVLAQKFVEVDEELDEIDSPTISNEESVPNDFDKKVGKQSLLDLASKETLYILKSLHKLENGSHVLDELGYKELADFSTTWNNLMRAVSGEKNLLSILKKIKEVSQETYPEFKQLLESKLPKGESIANIYDLKTSTNFWQDVQRTRVTYLQTTIFENNVAEVTKASIETLSILKKFEAKFKSDLNNKHIERSTDNNIAFLNLKKVVEDFGINGVLNASKSYEFARAIGLYLDDLTVIKYELNKNQKAKEKYGLPWIYKNLFDMNVLNESANTSPKVRDAITNFRMNPIVSLSKGIEAGVLDTKEVNQRSTINNIISLQALYGADSANFAVLNAERNLVFEHIDDHTASMITYAINNAKKMTDLWTKGSEFEFMSYLNPEINSFTKRLQTLSNIFDFRDNFTKREGKSLQLFINSGTQVEVEDGGTNTTSLDANGKFLQEMNSMLKGGLIEFIRHASKQASFGMRVNGGINEGIDRGKKDPRLWVNIDKFAIGTADDYAIKTHMIPYLAGELERINKFRSNPELFKNYKGYNRPMADGTVAGENFTAFDNVLTKETKQDILDAVTDPNIRLEDYLKTDPELKRKIEVDITSYFSQLTNDSVGFYEQAKYLSPDLVDNLKIYNMSTEETERALIKAYTVNAWIQNFETATLVYGDIAQYNHEKEELHKRNTGSTSGGLKFRVDAAIKSFLNKLNSKVSYAATIPGMETLTYTGKLNTAIVQELKRDSKYIDQIREGLTKDYTEKLSKVLPADKVQAAVKMRVAAESSKYLQMEEGDGQGWITFDAYRALKQASGQWSDLQEDLFKKIIKNIPVSKADIVEMFPVYKLQNYGHLANTMIPVMAMHKFALAPLIPSMVKNSDLQSLHEQMMKKNIQYVTFQSGSKVGSVTSNGSADEIYEANSDNKTLKKDIKFTPNTIYLEYLKDVTKVPATYKGKTVFATQLRKIILSNLYADGEIINKDNVTAIKAYEKAVDDYGDLLKLELLNEINYEYNPETGKYTGNFENFLKLIQKELTRKDIAEHHIEFINMNLDNTLKTDLSLHLKSDDIEKILVSLIEKRLVRQKIKGEALVQVSSAMTNGMWGTSTKFEAGNEESVRKFMGTNNLPFYNYSKDGTSAMKVAISLQGDFVNLLNLNYKGAKIGTRARLNEAIKDEEWLNEGTNRKAVTLTAVRIPVQGLNSMEFMEVHEFLDESAGNLIIPPTEIVAKSGADFDVDKLTTFMPALDKFGKFIESGLSNEGLKNIIKQNKGTAEGTALNERVIAQQKAALENRLITTINDILKLPSNYASLVRPNATYLLKDEIADKLEDKVTDYNRFQNYHNEEQRVGKKTKRAISPTRTLEPLYNIHKHEANMVGKSVLGLVALFNALHPVFNSLGAAMPKTYKNTEYDFNLGQMVEKTKDLDSKLFLPHNKTKDGRISLSGIQTQDGDLISELYSQLINGTVDVEKDAWIFFIQGNMELAPMLLMLLKAGVPAGHAIKFLSQPLIREYAKQQRLLGGSYANLVEGADTSKMYVKDKAAVKVLTEFGVKNPIAFVNNKYTTAERFEKKSGILNKDGHFDIQLLDKILDEPENKSFDDHSLAIFMHFLELENQFSGFQDVIRLANPDTKTSKSIQEVIKRNVALDDLVNNSKIDPALVEGLRKESILNTFYDNKIISDLVEPLFKLKDNKFVTKSMIEFSKFKRSAIKKAFGTGDDGVSLFMTQFKNGMVNSIFQNYMRNYVNSGNDVLDIPTELLSKYFTDNVFFIESDVSYADDLMALIEKHSGLKDKYSVLQQIASPILKGGEKVLSLNNQKLLVKGNYTEQYYENIKQLADVNVKKVEDTVENKYISDMFKVLPLISLYQNGVGYSKYGFNEILPYEDFVTIMDKASNDFMKTSLNAETMMELFDIVSDPDTRNFKNYLSMTKPFVAQKVIETKKGVQEVFEDNPELANVGTPQQYSQYLDTIFPDSKVKDIVYHQASGKLEGEKFDKNKSAYFTDYIYFAYNIDHAKEYYTGEGDILYRAIVNLKNPIIFEDKTFNSKDKALESLDKNYDGMINKAGDYTDRPSEEVIVREPEQIHILGSKQDIKGFKDFVLSKPTTQPFTTAVKPESLLDEETLSYFKSGVDQGIEAIKKQYEERLKNLEYLSKKTTLSGITQDEYDKKVNYINAEYNEKISKVGKMRYRINLESARDIELAELKRKYEGTTQPSTSVKPNMINDSIKDTQLDLFNQTPLTFGGKSINEQLEIMNTPEFKSFFAEETIKNPNLDASEALDYYIKCKGL